MIDNENLRTTVVTGLKEYLGIPVIQSSQNREPPEYPYISYTVTTVEKANNGTWGKYDDGIDRIPVTQTWSITVQSDDESESISYASKAREFLTHTGRCYLNDNDVIVQSVTDITNRDNMISIEYEYKNGFDVVFWLLSESENPIDRTSWIEIVINNKEE